MLLILRPVNRFFDVVHAVVAVLAKHPAIDGVRFGHCCFIVPPLDARVPYAPGWTQDGPQRASSTLAVNDCLAAVWAIQANSGVWYGFGVILSPFLFPTPQ